MRESLPPPLGEALVRLAARRPDLRVDVRWFETVASTMDVAADAASGGAPAGFVVIAGRQIAGRGRRGHTWASPPDAGLYFSYLARPARHLELVTLAAGVAVVRGVEASTGVRSHIKWPNDVLIGDRKLAGVLAEGAHLGTPEAAVTIGIGVNVQPAAYPPEVAARATNLADEIGRPVSSSELFVAIVENLADALAALEREEASGILRSWRELAPTAVGTTVRWSDGGRRQEGTTAGIDEHGALLVRTPSGVERVIAGELQWDLR